MSTDGVLTITDPVRERAPRHPVLARLFGKHLRDEDDLPFVRLSLTLMVLFVPLAVALFVPGVFSWWLGLVYLALYLVMLPPFILALHCTSHRPLFKNKHGLGNKIIPWINGPLLGMSPETYFAHHIGMHHVEGNLPADLSSTMAYQRDSFRDFLRYWARFFFLGDVELVRYFARRGKTRMLRRFVVGEAAFFAVMIAALAINWRAGLVVFVLPFFLTRFLLMMGNWAQHAFIDPDHPTDDFRTVVSFINSAYNRRCFNDGYHLGHHLKASQHWLDYPTEFLARRQELAERGALVFRTIDYTAIFILLMFKRYRLLARFYVQLDPERPKSEDEVVALLQRRVQRFTPEQLAALHA